MASARTVVGTASSATGSAVLKLDLTLGVAIPAGSLVVLGGFSSSTTTTGITVADTAGNTYSSVRNTALPNSKGVQSAFVAENVFPLAIGDTITLTVPSSTNVNLAVSYLSGQVTPAYLNITGATGTSTAAATGTPTVNATDVLPTGSIAVCFIAFNKAASFTQTSTPGGSWSAGQNVQAQGSSNQTGIFELYQSYNGAEIAAASTLGTSTDWEACVLHFKAARTFFVDPEGGSDFNGGDSFAVTAGTANGVGNGTTTFTDAGASFDSTYLGRCINITKVGTTTQATYLIAAINSGTSIVLNGTLATNTGYTWKVGGRFRTPGFGGLVDQNTPLTGFLSSGGFQGSAVPVAGDTYRFMADTGVVDTTLTASWTSNTNPVTPTTASKSITVSAAQNLDVSDCDSAWTASANITSTADTADGFMQGTHCAKHVVAAGFTTGLASFFATGTINLSSYQQVCFWIKTTVAILAGQYSIRLCSDAAGVTTVNNIGIPAIPTTGQWTPVVINTGGALGTSIASVALYVDSDQGAVTIDLDNIFAAKAPGATALTLNTLVGKNTSPEPFWWPIKSISGTTVTLDTGPPFVGCSIANLRGYYGVTEASPELWKREPSILTMYGSTVNEFSLRHSGNRANNNGVVTMNYSGGWDRTAMSSQSGQTWYAWMGTLTMATDDLIDNFGFVRFFSFSTNDSLNFIGTVWLLCSSAGNTMFARIVHATYLYMMGTAFSTAFQGNGMGRIDTLIAHCCTGIPIPWTPSFIGTLTSCNNNGVGISLSSNTLVSNCGDIKVNNGVAFDATTSVGVVIRGAPNVANGNSVNTVNVPTGSGSSVQQMGGSIIIENLVTTDAMPGSMTPAVSLGEVRLDRYGGSDTDFRMYSNKGTVLSDTSTRHTASGIAWSLQPADNNLIIDQYQQLRFKIGSVAVNSGSLVTFTLWMMRDHTALNLQLACPGGQLPGVGTAGADVVDTCTAAANVWEQRTIMFTPTAVGVVDIYAYCWGKGTYKGWVDDAGVTQA